MMMKAREDMDVSSMAKGIAISRVAASDSATMNLPETTRKESLQQNNWNLPA